MICKNCGQDNPPKASFCQKCGAALVKTFASGVGSSYSNGWKQLWKHFLELFLILIINWVISGVGGFICSLVFLQIPFSVFVGFPLNYGFSYAYLKAARDQNLKIDDMFAGFRNYWNAVAANILVSIIIGIGPLIFGALLFYLGESSAGPVAILIGAMVFVLFLIAAIFFACKLAFVPYLVVDRKAGCIKAIKGSWSMTRGHGWKVFLIGLLAIPIGIAGLICFGVGIIISIMWVSMAMASLYHAVSTSGAAPKPLSPTAPPPTAT
jgi:uncharacterized membrane protein